MQGTDRRARSGRALLLAVYAALVVLVLAEKWGQTTNDTRLELTEAPGAHLAGTFSLWSSSSSLGELQNQAYGYLFPQGSFFWLLDLVGMPGWLTQRFWSALVLLVACEGVRRLALALGLGPWGAAAAGLAHGLVPRLVMELGTRSAEILPGAVVPWALLPIVLAIDGRLRPRNAAVLSAAAFACGGGVNGTATAAPAALLAVVVGWAVWRRHLSWRFGLGWLALIGAVSVWWLVALVRLGAYSPPFFDFVEDARTTTSTSGFSAALRGASNWIGYLTVGGERWWPAGHDLAYDPWLVLGTGLVAALGFVGLLRLRGRLRGPLLFAAALGLACQVIAHTGTLAGPVSQALQHLLDGPLAPLRNVPKADPVLRVPLVLGVGVLADDLVRLLGRAARSRAGGRRETARRWAAGGLSLALAGGLVASLQPIATADTRTPGWQQIPGYWTDAATFLDDRARETRGSGTTWVVPGSGFSIQQWGWTMEEVMEGVGRTPWITRSQVPLAPSATIRMLSVLESYLETGSGSPYLRQLLGRIGIDTVLVRHDLDPAVSEATPASLVAVAIARSPGLERVATFGRLEFGPAIEVYAVDPVAGTPDAGGYDLRDVDDTVTVAGSVEAELAAVGAGLVAPGQPAVLAGTPGWERRASVIGDGYRLRERNFGQVHDAEGNVMAVGEPSRTGRVVANYPAPAGADPVVARYDGIAAVDASSSAGWATTVGPVRPEDAPWSALDGDPTTYWRPAPFRDTVGQWLEVDLGRERRVGRVDLREPRSIRGLDPVLRWRVTVGGESREVVPDPVTGEAGVELDVRADTVRVEVVDVPSRQAAVGLAELAIQGVDASRTLVLPDVPTAGTPDLLFSARPGQRACVPTLLGPDCVESRRRASDEASGIDRTFTLAEAGRWAVRGLVVARSSAGTLDLLQPASSTRLTGSSWLAEDPMVAPRMAHDDDRATSWVADPRDREPTLTLDLGATRTVRRLAVSAPAGRAVRPDHAVIRAQTATGEEVREVALDGLGGYGAFEPLRARRLTITFTRQRAVVGTPPLGIGELTLAGAQVAEPLDGARSTGSVCGLGPTLEVDGRAVETRVEGLIGDVVAAGQLAVVPCGTDEVELPAGEHRVRLTSTEQFQPVALTLAAGRGDRDSHLRSRDVELLSRSDTRVRLRITAGEEAILSAPHNVNDGWRARVGGREVEPITVDGWAQGWIVPAGVAGEVELDYAPQRGYVVGLVAGLVLLGGILLLALAIVVTGRARSHPVGRPTAPTPPAPVPARGGRTLVALLVTAGVVGWLVGGPLVAPAAMLGVLLGRRPQVVQALVGALLLGALVALTVQLAGEAQRPPAAVDLVTGMALALGLAAGLLGSAATRSEGG